MPIYMQIGQQIVRSPDEDEILDEKRAIKGTSTDSTHIGWIPVQACDVGRHGKIRSLGDIDRIEFLTISSVRCLRWLDVSSGDISRLSLSGNVVAVNIDWVQDDGGHLRLRLRLSGVLASFYAVTSGGTRAPVESFELAANKISIEYQVSPDVGDRDADWYGLRNQQKNALSRCSIIAALPLVQASESGVMLKRVAALAPAASTRSAISRLSRCAARRAFMAPPVPTGILQGEDISRRVGSPTGGRAGVDHDGEYCHLACRKEASDRLYSYFCNHMWLSCSFRMVHSPSTTSGALTGASTRIIVKFEGYTGRYVRHCHILEHEDNE